MEKLRKVISQINMSFTLIQKLFLLLKQQQLKDEAKKKICGDQPYAT